MKQIQLKDTHLVAMVDDEDFGLLSKFRWRLNDKGYAVTTFHTANVTMQWLLMGNMPKGAGDVKPMIDHIDRDKLNNRKGNLRFCSQAQNNCNNLRIKKRKSKYKGVHYDGKGYKLKWAAACQFNGIKKYARFATEEEAGKAYDEFAKELHGEFAVLNFPT